jgi:endogenous inhibitor of DNA gyrase (YacG/DUF329 family)
MAETRKCPICKRPVVARYRPFCSKRCADLDLGRWLDGAYAIPAEEDEEESEAPRDGEGQESRESRH